jgi:hypothetical protein
MKAHELVYASEKKKAILFISSKVCTTKTFSLILFFPCLGVKSVFSFEKQIVMIYKKKKKTMIVNFLKTV